MKNTNGPTKATIMPRTKLARKTTTFTVETHVSPEHFWAFNHLAGHYHLPLEHLLQSEAYGQIETIVDCPFSTLESMDDQDTPAAPRKVKLTFCRDAHALLSRLADLLRRPLPELLAGLLAESGDSLQYWIGECMKEAEGMDHDDLAGWADRAIRFERLARRNIAPGANFNGTGWQTYNLTPPAVRAVKKGGAA